MSNDYITGPEPGYPFISYTPNGYQRAMSWYPRSVWEAHGFPLLDPPLRGTSAMRGSIFLNARPVVPHQSDFTSGIVNSPTPYARAISAGAARPIPVPAYTGPYPRTNSVPFPGMFMRGAAPTDSAAAQAEESAAQAAAAFVTLFDAILSGQENIGSLSVLVAYVDGAGAGIRDVPLWLVGQGYDEAAARGAAEFYARVEQVATFEQVATILSVAKADPRLLTEKQWTKLLGILEITSAQFGTSSLDQLGAGPAQPQQQDKAKTWPLLLAAALTAYAMSR